MKPNLRTVSHFYLKPLFSSLSLSICLLDSDSSFDHFGTTYTDALTTLFASKFIKYNFG